MKPGLYTLANNAWFVPLCWNKEDAGEGSEFVRENSLVVVFETLSSAPWWTVPPVPRHHHIVPCAIVFTEHGMGFICSTSYVPVGE